MTDAKESKAVRPPFEHWCTAADNRREFHEQFAGYVFYMLHDKIRHRCRIEEGLCVSPRDEWAMLTDEESFAFLLLGGTALEQVQRWIAQGIQKPHSIPLGDLVIRPEWAKQRWPETKSDSQ